MQKVQRCSLLAKEIEGWLAVDVDSPNHAEIVGALAQQTLHSIAGAMPFPPGSIAGSQLWKVQWVPDVGIQFFWALTLPGAPQPLRFDHIVPLDSRELSQASLHQGFNIRYHHIKERLAAMEKQATGSELDACAERLHCTGDEGLCVVCQDSLCC